MKTRRILPLTVYEFDCDNALLRRSLRALKALDWVANQRNSSSAGKLNCLPAFDDLHRWFDRCIAAAGDDLGLPFERLVVTQSWANRTMAGESHHGHVHQNSYLSGIFYLTTSKTGCTEFYRSDQWFDFFLLDEPDTVRALTFSQYPTAGKLLLFPSNLEHCVAKHASEAPRFTISFNTFPQGKIGDDPNGLRFLNLEVLPYGREKAPRRA